MTGAITKNTLYSAPFEIFRDILLRGSTTLSSKFKITDFVKFWPETGKDIPGYPFICIQGPGIGEEFIAMKCVKNMSFEVLITIAMEWHARDNLDIYSDEVPKQINSNQSTLLNTYSANDLIINSSPSAPDWIGEKRIVRRDFTVMFNMPMDVES